MLYRNQPLTAEIIDRLPAGRDLDYLIAEHVFGWRLIRPSPRSVEVLRPPTYREGDGTEIPHEYSLYLDAAMLVQAALDQLGYWCQIRSSFGAALSSSYNGWWCGFTLHLVTGWNGQPDHWTNAEILPLAICRSALKVMVERESVATASPVSEVSQ